MKRIYFTPFIILFCYFLAGIYHHFWGPSGEVASYLIIAGGSSAIFYLFLATNYEERFLSLISFLSSNIVIFYILVVPDPSIFLVFLFLILLLLFFFFDNNFFLDCLFYAVLLSRIFFSPIMGIWGFGLVTELMFLGLYSLFFHYDNNQSYIKGSIRKPLCCLLPLFCIAIMNLRMKNNGLNDILVQIVFLFTGASLIYILFLSKTIKELKIFIYIYISGNCSIGFILADSLSTFCLVSAVFLIFNLILAGLFLLKAQRSNKPLSNILLYNNKEGIHIVLFFYFIMLLDFLGRLNIGSVSLYSYWVIGLGFQIAFLTALNYFIIRKTGREFGIQDR